MEGGEGTALDGGDGGGYLVFVGEGHFGVEVVVGHVCWGVFVHCIMAAVAYLLSTALLASASFCFMVVFSLVSIFGGEDGSIRKIFISLQPHRQRRLK